MISDFVSFTSGKEHFGKEHLLPCSPQTHVKFRLCNTEFSEDPIEKETGVKIYVFLSIYARDSDNDATPMRRCNSEWRL